MLPRHFPAVLLAAVAWLPVSAAFADEQGTDRHAGYYYPPPAYTEVYKARAVTLAEADKGRRIDFVVAIVNSMNARPYAPPYAVFAKGDDAEKMIIVANQDGTLNTIYRAKALLATLTGVARAMPIFRDNHVEEILTFFDLLKMLGFQRITVSDGDAFAHQVDIE